MDDKIFRKSSIERLSSPENLDHVMRVVPAKNWVALVCLFAVAAVFLAWAFFGEISRQVQRPGKLLLPYGLGAPQNVIAVLSVQDGRSVRVGMPASVTLDGQSSAVITGQVSCVAELNGQTVKLGSESIPASSLADWAPKMGDVAVLIELDADGAAIASNFLATADRVDAGLFWPCQTTVTVEKFHPVKLLLPG